MTTAQGLPLPRTRRAAVASRGVGGPWVVDFVYLWWVPIILEPDWFLAAMRPQPAT